MRILYRVAPEVSGSPGPPVDIELRLADDATVGEAADAAAAHLAALGRSTPAHPTLSSGRAGGSRFGRDTRVVDGAPPSGSTIRLVEEREVPAAPPWRSPVTLHRPGGATSPLALPYGTTGVGPAEIEVTNQIVVRATGSPLRLDVDGHAVRGSTTVGPGAILSLGEQVVVVRCDAPLRPPRAVGPVRRHGRIPATVEDHEPVPVELPTPPGDQRMPGLPVLSAMVPLLMGVALWYATGSVAVAGFVLFSFVFVLASGIETRRESRAERRFRERSFHIDLDEAATELTARRRDQVARAERAAPTAAEIAGWLDGDTSRVWERRLHLSGAASVRLGRELVPGVDPAVVAAGGRRDLRAEVDRIVKDLERVEVPATVDLGVEHRVAIVGTGDDAPALARSIVCQLAGLLAPSELSVRVLGADDHHGGWDWVDWLPHVDPGGAGGPSRLHLVVRVGAEAEPMTSGRSPRQEPEHGPRTATILVTDSPVGLPEDTGVVVQVESGRATIRRGDRAATRFDPELVPSEQAEPLARRLAALRERVPGAGAPPWRVTLGDVLDPNLLLHPGAVVSSWTSTTAEGVGRRAPVGVTGDGVVAFDLTADGPHGLIAGTTGSGKSELLRTLVASLALHHPPHRLTFLFIDYKGGAAFSALTQLPHAVGMVTDLTPALARRALISLGAEIRRREALVAESGATDLSSLARRSGPSQVELPPDLVVVVDEFATLARDVPEFVDGLLDLAQRGRSLGIHLLLATQRPGGIVTDAMRANLSLRVVLRVADPDDSRDVIDTADAAHLPRQVPGRAILRTGPHRTTVLQVAHTGDPVHGPARARCSDLHRPHHDDPAARRPDDDPPTELDAAVRMCRAAAALLALPPPRRPWLDPLPDALDASRLPPPGRPGQVVLGLADRPDVQCQEPWAMDLDVGGGFLVLGGPASGTTSTLVTLAVGAARHPTVPFTVHGIDGARDLGALLGALADVVPADDLERTLRLLRCLHREVRRRAVDSVRPTVAPILLVLDGIGAFEELHAGVNRGEAMDLLVRLAVDGRGIGIHVATSAARRAEVPPALLAALDRKLVLRCAPDDALLAGVPPGIDLQDAPPGRGVIDGRLVQVGLAGTIAGEDAATGAAPPAGTVPAAAPARIPRLPTDLALVDLAPPSGWVLPVGIDADELQPACLDLTFHHALVVGPPRSGRTTALRTIVAQASRAHAATGLRVTWVGVDHPDGLGPAVQVADIDAVEEVAERCGSGGVELLVIDDLPELLDGPDGTRLDILLGRFITSSRRNDGSAVRVVAGGEADALLRCYSDCVRRLRSGRTGVLLRPDPDLHPTILHTALPPHDELAPAAGRGWLVSPDGPRAVQLAH